MPAPATNGTTLAKKDDKSTKNAPLIGIDIGGTGIKGGIVDLKKGKLVGDRLIGGEEEWNARPKQHAGDQIADQR